MQPSKPRPNRLIGLIQIFSLGVLLLGTGCQHLNTLACTMPQLPWNQPEPPPPVYPLTYSSFVAPSFKTTPPHRILLIESGRSHGNYGESQKLIEELASQIRAARLFEVVTPAKVRLRSQMDNILNGKFNEMEIAQLSKQYNADAVAFVRVNQLQAFVPMRTSVTLAIVDSYETVVTFSFDGNWDLASPGSRQAFCDYIESGQYPVPGKTKLHFQSPRALLAFAASQITETLGDSGR